MPADAPLSERTSAASSLAHRQGAALPIWAHKDAIVAAVKNHRVVVVEGPPGCGKTTQLPQMLLEAGLVPRRMGITQPRRIAAIGVANRMAEELGIPLGEDVGYAIRFDDRTGPQTRLKVMTDGILLQEARSDANLRAYDILLVDEAHERTLNIDFTLGLLHGILARRQDLTVVVSSATLHPGAFQRYFGEVVGKVPVVQIPSRQHPVEILYHPLGQDGGGLGPQAMAQRVADEVRERLAAHARGHVLVFLPGEGLIQRVAAELNAPPPPGTWVLPLFGRLPQKEQELVFAEQPGRRKVILATNIAETSITIDNTVAVIDCGLQKLPWYNARTGVTTLREEPVSLASANQRAGRAGRTGPGSVVRLYPEASMAERPEFTREEILRIDLSEAVLRLIDLGIREVETFAFPTPPPRGKLLAALEHLAALGAIDGERRLTQMGRRMVPYPLTPSLARMVVECASRFPDALRDVLLGAALLSGRSPFTYPQGQEEMAQLAQARQRHPMGDLMTAIAAWHRWDKAPDRASFCAKNFLEPDTMAFVARAHGQLVDIAEQLGNEVRPLRGTPEQILRSLAAGFADKLLRREGYLFETLQGLRVAIHPSSALYSSKTPFAVAAELMSSGRTYAFQVSALEPAWVAEVSQQACRVWQLRRDKRAPAPLATGKSRRDGAAAAPVPATSIVLGGQTFALKGRRRPKLELTLEEAAQLLPRSTQLLQDRQSPAWQNLQTKVLMPFAGPVLRGTLPEVLALLPELVRAARAAQQTPRRPVPPAAIVAWDRSLHMVARHLDALMALVTDPTGQHRPGFVALMHNGQGGIWYEVLPDLLDALLLSESTLAAMLAADDLAADDSLRQRLQALYQDLAARHGQLRVQALKRRLNEVR